MAIPGSRVRRESLRPQTVQYRDSEKVPYPASGWSQSIVLWSQSAVHQVAILTIHVEMDMGPKLIYDLVTRYTYAKQNNPPC